MTSSTPDYNYGFASRVFVGTKSSGESLVLGGVAETGERWTRVVTKRAAQMLWFHLIQYLFPDRADMVTAIASTAPIRDGSLPMITTHINVDTLDDTGYVITGLIEERSWAVRLTPYEAQRLWTALDIALYPMGWQKGESPH